MDGADSAAVNNNAKEGRQQVFPLFVSGVRTCPACYNNLTDRNRQRCYNQLATGKKNAQGQFLNLYV